MLAAAPEPPVLTDPNPNFWHNGYPSKPFSDEWFIAEPCTETASSLGASEEYAYDSTTADETYILKEKIKRWAQFPDSYI